MIDNYISNIFAKYKNGLHKLITKLGIQTNQKLAKNFTCVLTDVNKNFGGANSRTLAVKQKQK